MLAPENTPAHKALVITLYKRAIDGLATLGFLTPAQATTLKGLADTL